MHVLIVGAARQGTSLARYLSSQGAEVVLNDSRMASELQDARRRLSGVPIGWVLGDHPVRLLENTRLVCPSGGVPLDIPLVAEARRRGIPLSNDSQIFLEAAPCRTAGITGSAGKTTTTTLVGRMAEADYRAREGRVWVGGNIGNPLIAVLDQMKPVDLAVVELSSFQLELVHSAPAIAAVLNLTPNHLDRHETMEAYVAAKSNILRYQKAGDVVVLGRDDPGAWGLRTLVRGRLATFGMAPPQDAPWLDAHVRDGSVVLQRGEQVEVLMPVSDVLLRGVHNLLNVLAACAISAAGGIRAEAIRAGVQGFRGVPHRLEFVRRWGGADWYNDSIATAPERAIAAIQAFDAPIVLLAGGRDKNLPWKDFAGLVAGRVDHLLAFGEAGEMIAAQVRAQAGAGPETIACHTGLEDAVRAAAALVSDGDVVLLSPGGTSFDEFKDFAERGEWFKRWVSELQ